MGISYWLANHPTIVSFRWSHAQSWGSTWSFLVSSIALYILLSLSLHALLLLLNRRRPVPLGPIPALHSLLMAVFSATIFSGILVSSLYEIKETRWFWRRTKTTPLQWLLCFPLGTRPTGRVFFWSYLFYLTRFLHLLRTFFSILRRRSYALTRMLSHAALVCMSFLWLEFSQSFQVVAILSATMAHVVVFGYRFWVGVGLPSGGGAPNCFPVVLGCQVGLLCCNLVCHLGFLMLHFWKGGCSGLGAWAFNTVLNGGLLVLFLNCYVRRAVERRKGLLLDDDCGSHHCRRPETVPMEEKKKKKKEM